MSRASDIGIRHPSVVVASPLPTSKWNQLRYRSRRSRDATASSERSAHVDERVDARGVGVAVIEQAILRFDQRVLDAAAEVDREIAVDPPPPALQAFPGRNGES